MMGSIKFISFAGLWALVVLLSPIAWVYADSALMSRDDAYALLESNHHETVTSLPLGEREILLATLALDAGKVDAAIDMLDAETLVHNPLAALLRAEAYRRKSVAAAVRSGDYAHAVSADINKLKDIRLNTGLDEAEKRLAAFMASIQSREQVIQAAQSLADNHQDKAIEKPVVKADLNHKLTQDINDSVHAMLETWRKDWQSRDMQAYLSHYDKAFKTDAHDYASWANYKTRINRQKTYIDVRLSNIQIDMLDDGRSEEAVKVTFTQAYQSNNYASYSRKMLHLQRHDASADWRILFEGQP